MTNELELRALTTQADYQACLELQYETWGRQFKEAVPPSIMLVSQKLGGVTVGAFDRSGALIGFVFGLTGVRDGQLVHWSDMLAVRANAQNLGIGRRLKEHQRSAVARIGVRVVLWTYDPLVARNAHLNFNVFGVRVAEYVADMYGMGTGSDLHRGIGTDRLVVEWPVADAELDERKRQTAGARAASHYANAPIVGDAERPDARADAAIGPESHLRVAVPMDISALLQTAPALAASWRASTRAAFQRAFDAGYRADGFTVDGSVERGFYLMSRPSSPPSGSR